jgi:hypothetical protein
MTAETSGTPTIKQTKNNKQENEAVVTNQGHRRRSMNAVTQTIQTLRATNNIDRINCAQLLVRNGLIEPAVNLNMVLLMLLLANPPAHGPDKISAHVVNEDCCIVHESITPKARKACVHVLCVRTFGRGPA